MSTKQHKSNSNKEIYDVLIVGGGMVGASLAVALIPLNLKVGLIDAYEFGVAEQPSYDDRAIALSYGSSRIFSGMGLWDELGPNTTPIDKIHISDRGHFGSARLSAEKEKVPALGYLVESRILGKQLYDVLKNSEVEIIAPASVDDVQELEDGLTVNLKSNAQNRLCQKNGDIIESSVSENKTASSLKNSKKGGCVLNSPLKTRLLVAADGTQSKIRELSGIGISRSDYHQSAVIANISTEKPHNNQAFERFTSTGPIALLPLSDGRCSLVWTQDTKDSTATLDAIMVMDDKTFLEKLGDEFGYRLGRFTKAGKRSSYPLALVTSDKNTATRTVIIGNASHTMHPVAGQGLNLALRDVAVLADLIAKQRGDVGSDDLLNDYESQRDGDLKATVRYTDLLVRLFSNDDFLLGHARAGGLMAVDRIAAFRKIVTQQSMGINYRQSRLARGLALRAGG